MCFVFIYLFIKCLFVLVQGVVNRRLSLSQLGHGPGCPMRLPRCHTKGIHLFLPPCPKKKKRTIVYKWITGKGRQPSIQKEKKERTLGNLFRQVIWRRTSKRWCKISIYPRRSPFIPSPRLVEGMKWWRLKGHKVFFLQSVLFFSRFLWCLSSLSSFFVLFPPSLRVSTRKRWDGERSQLIRMFA